MRKGTKLFALLLVLMLCLSMLPVGALASAYSEEVYEAYEAYIYEFLLHELEVNSTMTMGMVEEFMALIEAGDYVSFPVEMLYNGMLVSGVAMTIDEFAAQYESGDYEGGVTMEYEITVDGVSGTAVYRSIGVRDGVLCFEIEFNEDIIGGYIEKGVWTAYEAEKQAVVDAVKAAFEGGGEEEEKPALGGSAGTYSEEVYEAYEAYIYEFLLHELEVNSSVTMEMVEGEFMSLIEARDYVSFPVEMLYNGMLASGTAMTIDEFAAQYGSGDYEGGVTMEYEITVDGVTGTAVYRSIGVRDGVLCFEIEFNEDMIGGYIDKGVWTAYEAYNQAVVDAVKAAFEGGGEEEEKPAPGGSAGTYSEEVYEAYEAYIYEFLLHELEVNSTMTMEMVEEFMAVVRARDYDVFPADMLYNGMLCSGVAMTIDEFAAQYLPGDLDGNGSLGAGDAVALIKCILNDSSGPAGDLNDDGATDVQDLIRLIRYLAGERVTLN